MDGILDGAEDAPAGGGAVLGWVAGGLLLGGVQVLRLGDAAADGPGERVEGGYDLDEGVWGRERRGRGGLRGRGLRRGGARLLCGLSVGLRGEVAGEAGADVDEVVQGLAGEFGVGGVGVCGRWAGGVLRGGVGC